MIGDGVENDAISHDVASVHRYIGSTAPFGAAAGLQHAGRAVVPPTLFILYRYGNVNWFTGRESRERSLLGAEVLLAPVNACRDRGGHGGRGRDRRGARDR